MLNRTLENRLWTIITNKTKRMSAERQRWFRAETMCAAIWFYKSFDPQH